MERIGSDVRRELGRFGRSAGDADAFAAAWPAAVGAEISANAWPTRLTRDGTLVVHTRDAVWAFELTLRGDEIRKRLGAPRMRFEAGVLPDAPRQPPPTKATSRAATPTAEERATAAGWAASVEDSELRERVARAAGASLASARSGRSV